MGRYSARRPPTPRTTSPCITSRTGITRISVFSFRFSVFGESVHCITENRKPKPKTKGGSHAFHAPARRSRLGGPDGRRHGLESRVLQRQGSRRLGRIDEVLERQGWRDCRLHSGGSWAQHVLVQQEEVRRFRAEFKVRLKDGIGNSGVQIR